MPPITSRVDAAAVDIVAAVGELGEKIDALNESINDLNASILDLNSLLTVRLPLASGKLKVTIL